MIIKKSIITNELGVFSEKSYNTGELLFILNGIILDHPTRESIHIGNNKHIVDKIGSFINHSFTPNIKILGKKVIALTKIEKETEICFDYNKNEINMACPFTVNNILVCGNKN